MAKQDPSETPLMRQYYAIKRSHPDAILLFRVGDFYETFCEDAVKASKILGIVLTKRSNGAAASMELAGFPYHALETYMPKLVRAGERVAICEQLEDPSTTTKLVKRGVVEMVTPGISFNSDVISNKQNNFVASVYFGRKATGISLLDVTTGEFLTAQGSNEFVEKLILGFSPKEILYPRGYKEHFFELFGKNHYTYPLDEWVYSGNGGEEKLKKQFGVSTLKGFGIEDLKEAVISAGAILYYLDHTEHKQVDHITGIRKIDEQRYVWLDKYSLRNLEITRSLHPNGRSLTDVIDKTVSPMGARLLQREVTLPLKNVQEIEQRLNTVTLLLNAKALREALREDLQQIGDIERTISKAATGKILPREAVQLSRSITAMSNIKKLCLGASDRQFRSFGEQIDDCPELNALIRRTLLEEPAVTIQKGGVIAMGVNLELDDLRRTLTNSKDFLLKVQERESEQTGIPSLKIAFNNVFGYYIEVRNAHKEKVPQEWIRKQTLANAERYITEELKEYEEKILGAEEKILAIETFLYNALIGEINKHIAALQAAANIAAQLDFFCGLATLAEEANYCRPQLNDGTRLSITNGRHPVIESLMKTGEPYIPNDLLLDNENQQILVITGPNMSGKSAILRQTALIVLLAQIGSYVPAQEATIGIVDKIFTRVGASDNISQGESTFMVEMLESAYIMNNITDRSLVLLDEIGRGTSTYDGISIAWAMVEYLHQHQGGRAKTLFATHYHELNEMQAIYPRIRNYNVAVKEINNRIIFLRKLVEGGTAHSFGIHVARMAGMPKFIVDRSQEILKMLEKRSGENATAQISEIPEELDQYKKEKGVESGMQLSFFQLDDPLIENLRTTLENLDINNLTPMDALKKLDEMKRLLGFK